MSKHLTQDDLRAMTLDEAKTELSNAVYAAALLIERLENAGKVNGNGHHAAQHIAKLACDELESRWRVNTPVTDAEPPTPANTRAQGPRSV